MFIKFVPIIFMLLMQTGYAEELPPIQICADPNPLEWGLEKGSAVLTPTAPSALGQTISGLGISADIVSATFTLMGRRVNFISDLPWKRCLSEVQNGHIDFAMGAYYNAERAKIYDYSNHYNTLTPQIFYTASISAVFANVSDLKPYRGCGMYGSSYTHYGLNEQDLDLGSGYDSLIRKLHAGRCDYFVEELEIIEAFKKTGANIFADKQIKHVAAPWAKAPSRYLITAKNGKNSVLLGQINAALNTLIKSGKAEKLWNSQITDIPYKP